VSVTRGAGAFTLTAHTTIVAPAGLDRVAWQLADYLAPATGWRLPVRRTAGGGPVIALRLDPSLALLGEEGYRLEVTPRRVTIRAAGAAGVFYGIQTLRQLFPPELLREAPVAGATWTAPAVTVEDRPRFAWRGAHLDAGRHFMPVSFVKKYLDVLALQKMNRFHWHLTEDQGWRLEILRYPRLTQIGSCSTVAFFQRVLDEVLDLFPGPWIHVGGDEAAKTQWDSSAAVQARIRELGVGDAHGLQSWFIRQMDHYLATRGRRLIGWDEILEGGLAPNATVMSWRGTAGGIAAARAGHDVVMTPTSHTYLDYYQTRDTAGHPLRIGGFLPLAVVYGYEPVPAELAPAEAARILGTQGQLWSEYLPTPRDVEWQAFPRLTALAEVAWSPRELRDFADFQRRLWSFLRRLDILDVLYYRDRARP
jgi:hexosaminidase